nr:MAG TPA: hypothetical protein [Caudoviricetes sp.]DAP06130.1 MAG TPA: hypothetical protein [Caudoviricetes sp.]DAU62344.1 MAG TPA: hypothetical protein [Caudoviricetes sp.]
MPQKTFRGRRLGDRNKLFCFCLPWNLPGRL